MNCIKTFFRPLAWMLVTGLTAAAVLTGCGGSSSSSSPTQAISLLAGHMDGDTIPGAARSNTGGPGFPNGTSGTADGTGSTALFYRPNGLAIDSSGNIYVTDSWEYTIRKITQAGVTSTIAGQAGTSGTADTATGPATLATFSRPGAMAFDSSGNLYVAELTNGGNNIRQITPAGVVTTFATGFNDPHGLTFDSTGNLYVADGKNSVIKVVTPGGVVSTLLTSGLTFSNPHGLAFDSTGNLYVADEGANVIYKVDTGGVVTVFAGSGSIGSGDGLGALATFSHPHGLVMSAAGNLYVADHYNSLVRKITSAGKVTTVAGVAGAKDFVPGALPGRINGPRGLAISGNTLYISSRFGVAKITPLP